MKRKSGITSWTPPGPGLSWPWASEKVTHLRVGQVTAQVECEGKNAPSVFLLLSAADGGRAGWGKKDPHPLPPPCTWGELAFQCVLRGQMTSSKRAPRLTSMESSLFMLCMVLAFKVLGFVLVWGFFCTLSELQSACKCPLAASV